MNRRAAPLAILAGLICGAAAVTGCNGSSTPAPTAPAPTPVLATDSFAGTIKPLGADSHPFTVVYSAGTSDASINITSLTTVANATPEAITIGVGFGTLSLGVCTLSSIQNPAAPVNTELPTSTGPFIAGQYCVEVFDNPAAPTVPEPLNYTLTVKHF